jgi:hypothetical protein
VYRLANYWIIDGYTWLQPPFRKDRKNAIEVAYAASLRSSSYLADIALGALVQAVCRLATSSKFRMAISNSRILNF